MSLILYYKDKWLLDCGLTQCKAWETVKIYRSAPFDELIWCHLSNVIDVEF